GVSLVRIGQWNSHGTRIRWPELETGANSVRPWTMPRMMAWRMVVAHSLQPVRPHRQRRAMARRNGIGRAANRPDLGTKPPWRSCAVSIGYDARRLNWRCLGPRSAPGPEP